MVVNWANPTRLYTSDYGGFDANDIVVYTFTTGSGASIPNNLPWVRGAEYGSGAANRNWNLSETKCSFDPPYLAFASHGESSAPNVPFTVVTPDQFGFYPVLKYNTTYYLNVKNAPGSGCVTACNMFFDLSKNGTP